MAVKICGVCPEYKSKLVDEFDICENLGHGGCGEVFKARWKLDGELYAIKKLDKTKIDTKYLKKEIEIKNLKHENIIKYVQCWEDENHLFIQMELCSVNLAEWLKKADINQRQKNGRRILDEIIAGVKYLHSKNLMHRDLKPENILFDKDGRIKIADFGLAAQTDSEREVYSLVGTRGYIAPEVWTLRYNNKCDIYSLGVIMKHFFNNKFDLLQKMLSINPEDRPSIEEVEHRLEASRCVSADLPFLTSIFSNIYITSSILLIFFLLIVLFVIVLRSNKFEQKKRKENYWESSPEPMNY